MLDIIKKCSFLSLLLGFTFTFANEYKKMTTDELMKLRGTIPVEDLEIYGAELTKRVRNLDERELEKYGILHLLEGKIFASDSKILH